MRDVKIAQGACAVLSIALLLRGVHCQQGFRVHDGGITMLDFLFSLGQAASMMLLLYGAFLVLAPVRKAPVLNPALEDELLLLKHIHNDA
jgi:hypothetical protein